MYYPLKKKHEVPDDGERERLNAENEVIRQNKLVNFAKPGSPGAKFKNQFEKMIKSLSLPKGAREELGITDDGQQPFSAKQGSVGGDLGPTTTDGGDKSALEERKETTSMSQRKDGDANDGDDARSVAAKEQDKEEKGNEEFKTLMSIFGEGKYHLIPSFFRTLIYLKKAKREFSIVFRTFGSDVANTIFEFNKFCNGDHPCYSGRGGTPLVKFDGSKGTKDLRIKESYQKALYYRFGTELSQSKLVTGTLKRVINLKKSNTFQVPRAENLNDVYSGDLEEGTVNIYNDPID